MQRRTASLCVACGWAARRGVIISLLLSAGAVGQELPAADVEHVWVDPAGRGSLWVGTGQTLEEAAFRLGVSAFSTYENLRVGSTAPLRDRLGFQVFGALGATRWLELGANVPVLVFQAGDGPFRPASAGLGNPLLHAKVALLGDGDPVRLSAGLAVGLPIGTGPALGNGGLEVAPKVELGRVHQGWQWGAELGVLYRPRVSFEAVTGRPSDVVGSQLWLAGTVTTVNTGGPRGEASVRVHAGLQGGAPGMEALLGVRVPTSDFELFAALGPGVFGAPDTPTLRVYLGLALANTPLPQPPCVEGEDGLVGACPLLDRDGDGVRNGVDRAPFEPEDLDGFEDEDGAPDPDDDGDVVPDAEDACPRTPGPRAQRGCPDVDTDGDSLVDRLDRCPAAAEDADGFEDADGCPDLDDDGDQVRDEQDRCPRQAGIPEEGGCPARDSDGDSVADHQDNCPQVRGAPGNAGCPGRRQLVALGRDMVRTQGKVHFDLGKARIQRRSFRLLDHLASVLLAHPELRLVRIENHTDDQGSPEVNRQLSSARAEAVRAYLVGRGVAAARLEAVGYGAERPLESNTTAVGREANRRVEFRLLER